MVSSTQERQEKIIEYLNKNGSIRIGDIMQMFGVSDVTVRKDLICLEEQGLLVRTHGGAEHTKRTRQNYSYQKMLNSHREEKEEIGEVVAEYIKDRSSVIISPGTTNVYIAQKLASRNHLLVITNSHRIMDVFENSYHTNIIFLGGMLNTAERSTYGEDTTEQLGKYMADVAILSVDGISAKGGITVFEAPEAGVYKKMIQQSNKVIVAADHTKIGNTSLSAVGALSDIDLIVTSKKADKDQIKEIQSLGVEVILI